MNQSSENNFTTEIPEENSFSTADTNDTVEVVDAEPLNNAEEVVCEETPFETTTVEEEPQAESLSEDDLSANVETEENTASVQEASVYESSPEQAGFGTYSSPSTPDSGYNSATTQTAGYVSSPIPTTSYTTIPQQTAGYTSGQIPTSGYSYDAPRNNPYAPDANTAYNYTQYGTVYTEPVEKNETNGPGIASLICGIIGFLLNPLYLVSMAAIITGIVGIAAANGKPKGTAIAGLILGIVSLIVQATFDFIIGVATLGACSCSILI